MSFNGVETACVVGCVFLFFDDFTDDSLLSSEDSREFDYAQYRVQPTW